MGSDGVKVSALGVVAMSETLLANEPLIRLTAFAGIFAVMAAWEILAPRRGQTLARGVRWPSNIGIVVLDAPPGLLDDDAVTVRRS